MNELLEIEHDIPLTTGWIWPIWRDPIDKLRFGQFCLFVCIILYLLLFLRTCKGNPNSQDEQLFSQDLVRGNPK
jgi:hypothetical protein